MKLTVDNNSTNYAATIVKLPAKQAIEGLDNLVRVDIFGNDILVSKDSDPSFKYIFFAAGTRLSFDFLTNNNLFRDPTLNKNQQAKGFFEPNGRVKGLKLRGVVSNGFVIPIDALKYLMGSSVIDLREDQEFTHIDGIEVCTKYFVETHADTEKKDKQNKVSAKLTDILLPNQFRFHKETEHLAKHLGVFDQEDVIAITDKWHGSSCILSSVLIRKPLKGWQKLMNKVYPFFSDKQQGYVYSSGKPKSNVPKNVLDHTGKEVFKSSNGSFYSSSIWQRAFEDYFQNVEKGISIYSELVGFEKNGGYIQKGFDYGCASGEYRMVVYRITYTKEDGAVIEFSWQQIKDYCQKYKMEHVPQFYFGSVRGYLLENNIDTNDADWKTKFFNTLATAYNLEKDCKHCQNKVPAEGITVRKDGNLSAYNTFKLKSKLFVLGESNAVEAEPES